MGARVPARTRKASAFGWCAGSKQGFLRRNRRSPWKARESVELATLEWVAWYNHERLMPPLGYIPPAEAEANYYRQLASQAAMVA